MRIGFAPVGLVMLAICTGNAGGFPDGESKIVAYPPIMGLATSGLFSVTVNGQEIWTEKFRTNMDIARFPDWFLEPYTRVQQEVHQASFSASGRLEISIRGPRAMRHVSIHPASRGIETRLKGNVLSFSLKGPDKVLIEIDSLPPLFLFANPIQGESVSPAAPGVHYFGPGVHHPGYITLKDSETVYIAAGAIVYGGIRAKGVRNIRVLGAGILDGGAEFDHMVLIENCQHVLVEGVMIRNGVEWTNTLINCDGITYDNVRVMSFGPAGDGIDPLGSRGVVISNCFLRCTDDCIAIKAPAPDQNVNGVLVTGNTMMGFAFSDGVTIGFETNAASVRNITVRDCDVLLARGGSRVDGHSGFSIICDGPAVIDSVLFESIRVEKSELKLFELNITDGTKYGVGQSGHIANVVLRNIAWAHEGPIVLRGFDEHHAIDGVTFENCTVAGRPLREIERAVMRTGEFVRHVTLK